MLAPNGVLLYLDEIQYFNKKQQQSLLEFLENGKITLIASTTENPYFYIYNALLSRCTVFEFKPLTVEETIPAVERALRIEQERSALPFSWAEDAQNRGGGLRRRCAQGGQRGGAAVPLGKAVGRQAICDKG